MSRNYTLALWTCGICCVLLSDVLVAKWGAEGIRDAGSLCVLSIILGVSLHLSLTFCGFLGIRPVMDAVDNRNPAAGIAACGIMASLSLVFAGGNIGEGVEFSENIFSVVLGLAGVCAMWGLLEKFGKISISITEERDLASGMRFCGFIAACGLISGRAVAGDWHSELATLSDFACDGWPAAVLLALALAVERVARPVRARPFPSWKMAGFVPTLCYIVFAITWVWHLGPWEGMR